MSRISLIVFLCVLSVFTAMSNPRWKIHPTFDGEVDNIFETPEYVYFTSRAMPDMGGQRRMSLFRYDKAGDEIQPLSAGNNLTSNTVTAAQYCPQKKYVVAVGSNYDITFLYDDGTVVSVPDYRLASLSSEKTVNSITIDPWHDRVYLATNFGYIALNDEKYEIAESRVYGEALSYVARVGDCLVISKGSDLLAAKANSARFSITDYDPINVTSVNMLAPVAENKCIAFGTNGAPHKITLIENDGDAVNSKVLMSGRFYSKANNKDGLFVAGQTSLMQINSDGEIKTLECPSLEYSLTAGSYNLTDLWQGLKRKGIKSFKIEESGNDLVLTRDYMIPNAPSPYATSQMSAHPTEGTLVVSYPRDYTFKDYPEAMPLLVSGYKDGWWSNFAPVYTNEERSSIMELPNGIAVDPDNPDYVYVGSWKYGLLRLNLADGNDIVHFSKPADKDNGKPGFIELVSNQFGCYFSAPHFDNSGNLWTVFGDLNNQSPSRIHLYCWEAADRRASMTSSNIVLPKKLEVSYDYKEENSTAVLPLLHSKNKNRLVLSSCNWNSDLGVLDTKGTPTDGSDDVLGVTSVFVDQDGNSLTINRIRSIWEDPLTGNVWVCHTTGVFYFDPDDFFKGGTPTMYRVKVARNDGTNLADRLLEDVLVNNMASDGNGRKWFATLGGGAVCTSADGRTIEEELNTSNSPIPSNDVYGLIYVKENNSMLISTSEGIAEYFLSGEGGSAGDGDLKIYPNPVRPDYFGFVTIEGLPERSIVKIVDASGNIVKEFGPVSGDVQWDVTNHQFRRVSSGVYFVLASAGENESAFSTVGKILVVN